MYPLCMKKRTTLQIEHQTLKKLEKLKITKRETYDELINRILLNKNLLSSKRGNQRWGKMAK